jgi:antimicrobial peptide system SdpA family protein
MRFKIVTVTILVIVASLLLYLLLLINSGDTTVSFSTTTKMWNRYVLPEGWSFFTKSPRGEEFSIYKIEGNELKPAMGNAFSIKYLFGFSRKQRTITTDLTLIYTEIADSLVWKEISQFPPDMNGYIEKSFASYQYNFQNPSLKEGKYILLRREITPWAYWAINPDICKNCQISHLWIK